MKISAPVEAEILTLHWKLNHKNKGINMLQPCHTAIHKVHNLWHWE